MRDGKASHRCFGNRNKKTDWERSEVKARKASVKGFCKAWNVRKRGHGRENKLEG